MSEMHPHKQAVLAALKSGPYAQTYGQLREANCFCAEGVVADVAAKLGLTEWVTFYGESNLRLPENGVFCDQFPEEIVGFAVKEVDLEIPESLLLEKYPTHKHLFPALDRSEVNPESFCLWGVNDVCRLTLSQIGELLEEKWRREE